MLVEALSACLPYGIDFNRRGDKRLYQCLGWLLQLPRTNTHQQLR